MAVVALVPVGGDLERALRRRDRRPALVRRSLPGDERCGRALADVNGRMMLQRLIPDKQLSRAFGVLESLYMAGEGIGSFLASLLVVAPGLGGPW